MKPLQLSNPHVIVVTGIPGSGKSYFAGKFSGTFNAPLVSFEVIKAHALNEVSARHMMQSLIVEILKTNQTIIVDGASDTRMERAGLTRLARRAGYKTLTVWVQTDPATAIKRTLQVDSNLTIDTYNRSLRRFTPPSLTENHVVISGKHTSASQIKAILRKLSEPRIAFQVQKNQTGRINQNLRRDVAT